MSCRHGNLATGMGRIIAIDHGTKRCGVAVTDELKLIATPLGCVRTILLLDFLRTYVGGHPVELFVVGWPTNFDNSPASHAPSVAAFLKELKGAFPRIGIFTQNERCTSQRARRALVEGGFKKKVRSVKANVDTISSTLILQSFLEERPGSSRIAALEAAEEGPR